MEFFTRDLWRNFAIGFFGGALAFAATSGGTFAFFPEAIAATLG